MSSRTVQEFTSRLREARAARKLSQSELALRANLQPAAISLFETGARKPSFDNLKRLADALRVTTDYLLGRSELMDASADVADQLHRNYSGLSADQQEMADDFIAMLANKAKQKRSEGE